MIEVQLTQGSQEWLEFRQTKRMASETPMIMGLSAYGSPATVRKAKWGTNAFVNDAMKQGNREEPIARDSYESKFEIMRPAVFLDGEYGASLDGINVDGDWILEIKTPFKDAENSDRWKEAEKGGVTPADYAQVQHQLMVTGAKGAHLWVWDAKAKEGILARVDPDPAYWDQIRKAWDEFFPTVQLRADDEWMVAATEWITAKYESDKAKDRLENAQSALQSLSGKQPFVAGAGVQIERTSRTGNVDWAKVQKKHLVGVDVDQYRKAGTTVTTIKRMASDAE